MELSIQGNAAHNKLLKDVDGRNSVYVLQIYERNFNLKSRTGRLCWLELSNFWWNLYQCLSLLQLVTQTIIYKQI
jgi:hypothetical protein